MQKKTLAKEQRGETILKRMLIFLDYLLGQFITRRSIGMREGNRISCIFIFYYAYKVFIFVCFSTLTH